MSVWKKASKANQKTHKERHQLEARKHLGLLEKKKDYVKRAQDYNEKQETLKILRKRALNRNPEEFYHHMINSKTKNGVHHEKDSTEEHTNDQLKLMETQDVRYVNMKRVQEMKRIERLQSGLHLIDVEKPKNNHKLFFESKKDALHFQENRKKDDVHFSLEKLSDKPLINFDADNLEQVTRTREGMYNELAGRIKRERELSVVQQKLKIKRYLQTKKKRIPPKKVSGATKDTPAVYRWRSQRLK